MNRLKSILLCLSVAFIGIIATGQVYTLDIYQNGVVSQSIPVANVDSIKVNKTLPAPVSVTASINGQYVQVSWNKVDNASSYEVYRSADDITYSLLASGITATSYADRSPKQGTNYYKVKAVNNESKSALSASSSVTFSGETVQSGLYMGIIGFNESLSKKPMNVLATNTKTEFTNYVDNLTTAKATVLYYAVDEAINDLASAKLPSDLINVSIVTFTDGLDQGSTMLNPSYTSDASYLSAIKNRINTVKIQNQPITAYSIGLKGNDVSDETQFMKNLENLASSGNAYLATNMSDVNSKFQEIANQLVTRTYSQTVSLKIPGLADGTKIRFTFDNVSSATSSTLYIEGTLTRADNSLKNVTYKGVKSSSGSVVTGTQSGVYLTFTFDELSKIDGAVIDMNYIKEWYCLSGGSTWQINSEFSPADDIDVTENLKSAAIMLVLDCSSSLGSDFSTIKTYAKNFISTMAENTNTYIPSSGIHNSHAYVYLGLPSGLKWATCNVGATSPEDYGNYYAWGETTTKSTYTESNSTTYGKTIGDISGNATYDVARANWGGTWRLPTASEIDELVNNCTWKWTSQGGVNGYKVTGKNGNSIFLPAAGYRYGSSLYIAGSNGCYWSSTPYESYADLACHLNFHSGIYYRNGDYRKDGQSVRPVTE